VTHRERQGRDRHRLDPESEPAAIRDWLLPQVDRTIPGANELPLLHGPAIRRSAVFRSSCCQGEYEVVVCPHWARGKLAEDPPQDPDC